MHLNESNSICPPKEVGAYNDVVRTTRLFLAGILTSASDAVLDVDQRRRFSWNFFRICETLTIVNLSYKYTHSFSLIAHYNIMNI